MHSAWTGGRFGLCGLTSEKVNITEVIDLACGLGLRSGRGLIWLAINSALFFASTMESRLRTNVPTPNKRGVPSWVGEKG